MTLNEQIQALVRAAAESGLDYDDLAPHIRQAFVDADEVGPVDRGPEAYCMIQTELSRKLLGEKFWFWTNRQLVTGSKFTEFDFGLMALDISRIRINVGCDADGTLRPAAFRGFPQANSAQDTEAFLRCNGTVFVFDVKDSRFGVMLDKDRPMGKVVGPGYVMCAIRAVSDEAVDEYLHRIAAAQQ